MSVRPLPNPALVTVGQNGASALWNSGAVPAGAFLANRPYATLAQTVLQTASGAVAFNSGFDNTGVAHSNTVNNSRYTAPLTGLYHVSGQVSLKPPVPFPYPVCYAWAYLQRNGDLNQQWGVTRMYVDSQYGCTVQITAELTLKAGDYIELYFASVNGGSTVSTWDGFRAPRMSVHWVST